MAEIPFTGERFVPTEKGRIAYEQHHRYAACLQAATGKTVLDLACGEGFGSALLASRAAEVIGVDIDSATIRHATEKYWHVTNATFVVGDCRAVPLAANSVDLIVSFETIEHIEEHEQLLKEFLRVLRPSGAIIISSPDRENYSEKPGFTNPYHVHELTHEQFVRLFREKFRFVNVYRQRLAIASFVLAEEVKRPKLLHSFMAGKHGVEPGSRPLRGSLYSIVFCSNNKATLQSIGSSVHLDTEDDLYLEKERVLRWAAGLHAEHEVLRREIQASNSAVADAKNNSAELNETARMLAETLGELTRRNADAEAMCRELRSALSQQTAEGQRLQAQLSQQTAKGQRLQAQLSQQTAEGQRLQAQLSQQTAEGQRLQAELSQQTAEGQRLQAQLSQQTAKSQQLQAEVWQRRAEIDAIRGSLSWRLTSPLRTIATISGISRTANLALRLIWWTITLQLYRRFRERKQLATETTLIANSGLFDTDWYYAQYPDVAAAGLNPLLHYLRHGAAEGRDPNPQRNHILAAQC